MYLCTLRVYFLYFESTFAYFESILLYFQSILLYFESIFVFFESILCVIWKCTFVLWKYTFVLWKYTFVLPKYTFVLWKYICVLWKTVCLLWKYTLCNLKVYFCTSRVYFCTSKVYFCISRVYFCTLKVYFCISRVYFCTLKPRPTQPALHCIPANCFFRGGGWPNRLFWSLMIMTRLNVHTSTASRTFLLFGILNSNLHRMFRRPFPSTTKTRSIDHGLFPHATDVVHRRHISRDVERFIPGWDSPHLHHVPQWLLTCLNCHVDVW